MPDTSRMRIESLTRRDFCVRLPTSPRRLSAPRVAQPDEDGRLRIGRGAPDAAVSAGWLRLEDPTVSHAHAELMASPAGVCVRDTSTNGTWVNGVKLLGGAVELSDDGELRVGRSVLRLEFAPGVRAVAVSAEESFGDLVGVSAAMRRVFDRARRVAGHDVPVLILGETGTGKSRLARVIHAAGRRAAATFRVIDCGALSAALLESELFGHVRGAFTHATADRRGLFEDADGGTVFLDEVAELSTEAQTRLLRALDERVVRRVGDNLDRPVNVRVIAATHQNLAARVSAGQFRLDLYERLAGVTVEIPALRERREDLRPLADELLGRIRARGEVRVPEGFALGPAHYDDIEGRVWAGNVRELQRYLEALIVTDEPPPERAGQTASPADGAIAFADLLDRPYEEAHAELRARFNQIYLRRHLRLARNRVQEAARRTGLHRVTLARLRDECGLPRGAADDEGEG